MKLGKCIVIPVDAEGPNKEAVLDLDNPALQEAIARFAFDQTEQGQMDWESAEPMDKAYEIEYVQWVLKMLTVLAKKARGGNGS